MQIDQEKFDEIRNELNSRGAILVAVSKTKPASAIMELYDLGQRDFGENYVQELVDKEKELPKDIHWHFIGHLQTNKVKYIAPFVHLIHGVDSLKLLKEINKQGLNNNRIISVLLQVHIAQEDTKFGFNEEELNALFEQKEQLTSLKNIRIEGLMGMASFTEYEQQVSKEFKYLKSLFEHIKMQIAGNVTMNYLSMGMSGDYHIALQEGSNMVRIGSLLFGARQYKG